VALSRQAESVRNFRILTAALAVWYACGCSTTPETSERPVPVKDQVRRLCEEELAEAKKLVALLPEEPRAWALLGNAYSRQGMQDLASSAWRKALSLRPGDPSGYFALAEVAFRREEFAKAEELLKNLLSGTPAYPGAYRKLGEIYLLQGRPAEAAEALRKELERCGPSPRTLFFLGRALQAQGDLERAERLYRRVLALDSGYAKAYWAVAHILLRKGKRAEARDHLESFKKLKAKEGIVDRGMRAAYDDLKARRSELADALCSLAEVYQAHGRTRDAERLLERACAADGRNVRALERLSDLYVSSGRIKEALALCERLRALEDKNALRFVNRGVLEARLGLFDRAERSFKKACELAPGSSDGWRLLAQIYLDQNKNLEEGFALAKKAAALEEKASNYFLLGAYYVKRERRKAALEALRRAVALDPGNAVYRATYLRFTRRGGKESEK